VTARQPDYLHLLGKARDAKRGGRDAWCCQSTGERVAVALVLNRAGWLAEMGYTLAEAVDRAGPSVTPLLLTMQRTLQNEN
jgi:hypothetical protein